MKTSIKFLNRTTMMLLILILPACMYAITPLSASTEGGDTSNGGDTSDGGSAGDGGDTSDGSSSSSASQDYQEFQACLSDAEVGGSVSEQQIRDCFAPIYNTGPVTTGSGPSDTPSGGEDTSSPSNSDENDADNSDGSGGSGGSGEPSGN
jgi:hypothetical protein